MCLCVCAHVASVSQLIPLNLSNPLADRLVWPKLILMVLTAHPFQPSVTGYFIFPLLTHLITLHWILKDKSIYILELVHLTRPICSMCNKNDVSVTMGFWWMVPVDKVLKVLFVLTWITFKLNLKQNDIHHLLLIIFVMAEDSVCINFLRWLHNKI